MALPAELLHRLASQLAQLAAQLAAQATMFACSKRHIEGILPACC
jgi:hypothetical protein